MNVYMVRRKMVLTTSKRNSKKTETKAIVAVVVKIIIMKAWCAFLWLEKVSS